MARSRDPQPEPSEADLHALLDRLDRLEELLEEMDELGVSTRADIERLMADLHAQVDALEDENS